MSDNTAPTPTMPSAPGLDPLTAAATPIRATFTAVMAPYVTGDAPAPAEVFNILLEAVSAADPSADLIAGLCRMISEAETTPATMAIMHRATGAALGLAIPGTRTPARSTTTTAATRIPAAGAGQAGTSRPGSIAEAILQVLAAAPGQSFSVMELAKALGRGSGAVGAAVGMILTRSEAALASEFPRRIQALPTNAPRMPEPEADEPQPEAGTDAEQTEAPATDETAEPQAPAEQTSTPATPIRRKPARA